jgi:hypothetical protein
MKKGGAGLLIVHAIIPVSAFVVSRNKINNSLLMWKIVIIFGF